MYLECMRKDVKKMYVSELRNGLPPIWKFTYDRCPRDCGGLDFDEVVYIPFCPNCGTEIKDKSFRYCPYCGQKFYLEVRPPEFIIDSYDAEEES